MARQEEVLKERGVGEAQGMKELVSTQKIYAQMAIA